MSVSVSVCMFVACLGLGAVGVRYVRLGIVRCKLLPLMEWVAAAAVQLPLNQVTVENIAN